MAQEGGPRTKRSAARAARQTHVVQVSGFAVAKSSLAPDEKKLANNVGKAAVLRGKITEMVQRMATGDKRVLVIAAKDVREALTGHGCKGAPYEPWKGAEITHFGRHLGVNRWKFFDAVVVIGREQLPPVEAERIARAIYADAPGVALDLPGKYVEELRRHDLRDGIAPPVKVWVHPDKRVQAIVELSREQAMGQAIDRLRPVRRTQDRPAEVVVVSNLPVPGLIVDRLLALDDVLAGGTVWDRALARVETVLPLKPAWLVENMPDLFDSVRTAEREVANLKKKPLVFNDLVKEWRGGSKPPNGNKYIHCQMAVWKFQKSPKDAKLSNALVKECGLPGNVVLRIRSELAGLVGEEVADFRLIEAAPETPVQTSAFELPPPPFSTEVPGVPLGSVVSLGADPPLITPMLPPATPCAPVLVTSVPSPALQDRLAALSRRLEDARPPREWGDETDIVRHDHWQQRMWAKHGTGP